MLSMLYAVVHLSARLSVTRVDQPKMVDIMIMGL